MVEDYEMMVPFQALLMLGHTVVGIFYKINLDENNCSIIVINLIKNIIKSKL